MSFHVAVIPDGNRRWARMHGLPVLAGHKEGGRALERLIKDIIGLEELGIDCFTFWGASVANLTKRPLEETDFLNKLFANGFHALANNQAIHQHQIRVRVLGLWPLFLGKESQKSIEEAMEATAAYSRGMLNLLIAYDGTEEMLRAIQAIAEEAKRDASLIVTRQTIKDWLLTKELPSVDLVIRTGGEPHLSAGFMMWDVADAQLIFFKKLWPDFTPDDLRQAVMDFKGRKRRFGA